MEGTIDYSASSSQASSLEPIIDEELHPFDEGPVFCNSQTSVTPVCSVVQPTTTTTTEESATAAVCWQTLPCMQALSMMSVNDACIIRKQEGEEDNSIALEDDYSMLNPLLDNDHAKQTPVHQRARHHHPWTDCFMPVTPPSPPRPLRLPYLTSVTSIGPPEAQIFKITLPPQLISLLSPLVAVTEARAQKQRQHADSGSYYSNATCNKAPHSRPIVDYLKSQCQILFHCPSFWLDRPCVFKMTARQQGMRPLHAHDDNENDEDNSNGGILNNTRSEAVQLHLMLSRRMEYQGGIPWCEAPSLFHNTVPLEQGECLIYPSWTQITHQPVTSGTLYCLALLGLWRDPNQFNPHFSF